MTWDKSLLRVVKLVPLVCVDGDTDFCCSNTICTLQPVPPSNVWSLVVFLCNSPVFNTLLGRVHCNVLLARNACCKPSCNMLSVKGVIQTVQE